jgi:quinoprotein glucose dehydrogenase
MKMILAMAVALGGMSVATAAWCKDDPAAGAKLYTANCVACHGADRAGMPGAFPALTDIGKRISPRRSRKRSGRAAD